MTEANRSVAGEAVLAELRRPFAPSAVRWKVQAEWSTGAIVVAHIDARLVIERLNKVIGLNWRDEYTPLSQGQMMCALTVLDVTRHDVGAGADGKSMVSDALKRAAVRFGIGVSIYALRSVRMNAGDGEAELRTVAKNKKVDGAWKKVPVCTLDPTSLAWLAGKYEQWLEARGTEMFGEPLAHGDEEGAAGLELDVPVDTPGESEPDDVVELTDDRAEELKTAAREAFDTLRERGEMLPGEFGRRLRVASGSHEDLEAFVAELVERAAGGAS